MSRKLIIAGGGTGGHILAGVAVADEWKKQHPASDILFVGASGGIEERLVPRAGYPLELLKLGALNRTTLGRKLRTALQLPLAFLRSVAILLQARPQAVLGVGGYASGPLILTARVLSWLGILKCRSAILEQNSVPGFTNRVLGKFVNTVFCTFPGTEKQFKGKQTRITGNPIRSSMTRMPQAPREPFTLFAFGGSQGAVGINNLLLDALTHLQDLLPRIRIIHQTGEVDHARVVRGYAERGVSARLEKFIHEMPAAYAQSSLLICRAGSSTLSEVAAVGRAAVLVPFPYASDNHQQKNAEVFVSAGAAWMMLQGHATGSDLASLIRDLMNNPAPLAQMEALVTRFYKPEAARDIVRELSQ